MKTKFIHRELGCYDLLHPTERAESYFFRFGDTEVRFRYDEADAPRIDCVGLPPKEILDELDGYKSTKSISSNKIDWLEHRERIELAHNLAIVNRKDDITNVIEWIDGEKERYAEKIRLLDLRKAELLDELYNN